MDTPIRHKLRQGGPPRARRQQIRAMKPGPARPGKIEENRSPAQPGPAILSRGVARPSANRNKQKTSAIQNHPARFFWAPGKIRRSETNYATRLDAVGFELQDNQSGSPGSAKVANENRPSPADSRKARRDFWQLPRALARANPVQRCRPHWFGPARLISQGGSELVVCKIRPNTNWVLVAKPPVECGPVGTSASGLVHASL